MANTSLAHAKRAPVLPRKKVPDLRALRIAKPRPVQMAWTQVITKHCAPFPRAKPITINSLRKLARRFDLFLFLVSFRVLRRFRERGSRRQSPIPCQVLPRARRVSLQHCLE